MIRPATLADRDAILELVKPYMALYPLRPDHDRIKQLLTTLISSAKHFAWVSEQEGAGLGGIILGATSDNLWAQRSNCNILAWISTIPGDGAKLLRKFTEFVKSRRAIKVAGLCPDIDVDERAWLLAQRIGFQKRGGAYLLFN